MNNEEEARKSDGDQLDRLGYLEWQKNTVQEWNRCRTTHKFVCDRCGPGSEETLVSLDHNWTEERLNEEVPICGKCEGCKSLEVWEEPAAISSGCQGACDRAKAATPVTEATGAKAVTAATPLAKDATATAPQTSGRKRKSRSSDAPGPALGSDPLAATTDAADAAPGPAPPAAARPTNADPDCIGVGVEAGRAKLPCLRTSLDQILAKLDKLGFYGRAWLLDVRRLGSKQSRRRWWMLFLKKSKLVKAGLTKEECDELCDQLMSVAHRAAWTRQEWSDIILDTDHSVVKTHLNKLLKTYENNQLVPVQPTQHPCSPQTLADDDDMCIPVLELEDFPDNQLGLARPFRSEVLSYCRIEWFGPSIHNSNIPPIPQTAPSYLNRHPLRNSWHSTYFIWVPLYF